MTVEQLINELKKYDPNYDVLVSDEGISIWLNTDDEHILIQWLNE